MSLEHQDAPVGRRECLECIRARSRPFSDVRALRDAALVGLLVREAVDRRRQTAMTEIISS
ncbi:MAG: hypothetical protein JXA90_08895 [Planctomycetes bacterium]|nr:hypothetical protein [Planctomycetota bacterium]